ncbi:hypothetical protein EKO04_010798 [Ascochyta lentis]|uniref:Uncharacterized protein n=1 Tax=Ascochyta lentis TaxID=205686 RepID=A0A8H7IVE6_9PLEO|nr:hypothetical protein EKO04_010798 [Ascochyta lentis]
MIDFSNHPMPFFALREKSNTELDSLFKELNRYCCSDQSRYKTDMYFKTQTTMNRINRVFCERGFGNPGYEMGTYEDDPTNTTAPSSSAPSQAPIQEERPSGPSGSSHGLQDTHRLQRTTRAHVWLEPFIRTWSTAELTRVLKHITAEAIDPGSYEDALLSQWNIEYELAARLQDPTREARVVTEFLHTAPAAQQQQQHQRDIHTFASTQDIYVQTPRPVVHVHEQAQQVHFYPSPPPPPPLPPTPRIVYHQTETRIHHHRAPPIQTQTYIRRYGAGQAYERAVPQLEDVEFRSRGKGGKEGTSKG